MSGAMVCGTVRSAPSATLAIRGSGGAPLIPLRTSPANPAPSAVRKMAPMLCMLRTSCATAMSPVSNQ